MFCNPRETKERYQLMDYQQYYSGVKLICISLYTFINNSAYSFLSLIGKIVLLQVLLFLPQLMLNFMVVFRNIVYGFCLFKTSTTLVCLIIDLVSFQIMIRVFEVQQCFGFFMKMFSLDLQKFIYIQTMIVDRICKAIGSLGSLSYL